MRRLFLVLALLLTALAPHASAAPPSATALKQVATGTSQVGSFSVTLPKFPALGNSVVILVGMDAASAVGTLVPDDVESVIGVSESASAFRVAGAPYGVLYAADVQSGVRKWGFHGVNQSYTWVVAEFSGVAKFDSGTPRWDGNVWASTTQVPGTPTLDTGHRNQAIRPRMVLFAGFVAKGSVGVTSFANTNPQPGTWRRLGTSVTSGTHTLDVAYKVVSQFGVFDCTATWPQPPSGHTAWITGFVAV